MISRIRRHLIVIGTAIVISSGSPALPNSGPFAFAPNASGSGWRLKQLDLDVHVLPKEKRIEVEGRATLLLIADESFGPTLAMNAKSKVLHFDRMDASGATVAINEKHPKRKATLLAHVRFEDLQRRGTEIDISFAYHSEGRAFQFVVSHQAALSSWTQGWHPCPIPGRNERFSGLLLTTGTTRFFLPSGWRSVSNGKLVDTKKTADGVVETWTVDVPVARSFAAGPYEVARHTVGDRNIGVYLLSSKPQSAREQVQALASALGAMEARFGPYPYDSYAIAEIPDGLVHWYASSEQGFIMAKSEAFAYERGNLPLFAHEMAHGWWGNLISTTGDGAILCSESLAQYSAVIAIEGVEGEPAATEFLRFSRTGYSSQQCARGYFDLARHGKDKPLSQLESGGWQHTLSDAKGHWVYHMLRRRVGDEIFFGTLRELIRDFSGKSMSLDDLREAFTRNARPDAGLKQFFAQWMDQPGAPVLEAEFVGASKPGMTDLIIRQIQSGYPYELVVDVAIDTESGTEMHTTKIRDRETRISLAIVGKPTDVRLDPQHRLLIWKPEYGARP